MKDYIDSLILKVEKILISPCIRAKKARTLIRINLVLQAILIVTIYQELHAVFYLTLIFFLLVTIQLIVHISNIY